MAEGSSCHHFNPGLSLCITNGGTSRYHVSPDVTHYNVPIIYDEFLQQNLTCTHQGFGANFHFTGNTAKYSKVTPQGINHTNPESEIFLWATCPSVSQGHEKESVLE